MKNKYLLIMLTATNTLLSTDFGEDAVPNHENSSNQITSFFDTFNKFRAQFAEPAATHAELPVVAEPVTVIPITEALPAITIEIPTQPFQETITVIEPVVKSCSSRLSCIATALIPPFKKIATLTMATSPIILAAIHWYFLPQQQMERWITSTMADMKKQAITTTNEHSIEKLFARINYNHAEKKFVIERNYGKEELRSVTVTCK